MKKYSKEYAEKIAKQVYNNEINVDPRKLRGFHTGYMTAVKENNVEELIEACKIVKEQIEATGLSLERSMTAINKALKPHDND